MTVGELEEVHTIEYPKTREQLTLLLMRWNALQKQGVDPQQHAEMNHLAHVLHDVGAQQQRYAERRAELDTRRKGQKRDIRLQMSAFKLLARNVDLPESVQAVLLDVAGDLVKPTAGDKAKASYGALREARRHLLGRSDASESSVGNGAETIIRSRLSHRLAELERLSANLGTVDAKKVSFLPPDETEIDIDDLKIRALVELKELRLLTKQKSLRQHVVYHLASESDPAARSLMFRLFNRRVKAPNPQDLQLTEHLERQQRFEREQKERAGRLVLVNAAISHSQDLIQAASARLLKRQMLVKSIQQAHSQIEREETRKAERTAKQRLQALRSNDEEAYIKLLDQTKDTRITHLLKQTNSFLSSLSEAVRVQQAETGLASTATPAEDEDGDKIDYYEIAHQITEPVTAQPRMLRGGQLKEYQIKGLQWMVSLVNNNLNGILADEMGLGKTIQTISLLTYLIETKGWHGPFLVIVPLSTITNWNVEFDKWAPSIKKIVYKGPPNTRKALQASIRAGDFQVLLTTYEYIIKDRPLLSKIRWEHMIIDEGHRMKNTQSKLSSTLTQYYYSRFRLILTGTPLQNNLPELWALLNFVLPKIFNSVKTFDEWFNTPFATAGGSDRMELTEEESLLIIRRLHKVLRPFLLRRLKKDVEKDLPDKIEKVVKCKMSSLQAKLYEHMLKHNVLYVGAPADPSSNKLGIKGLRNRLMQLRKICNHPYVFEEVEDLINPSRGNNDQLWRTAGKFELLDRILPKFQRTGHRILIFFQMTAVMNIMEDYLRLKGVQYLRLDGSTKAEDRSEMLKAFNAPDSPYFCFLLSTRAGGLGLNLQTADTVIIYDTDWNPFQDLQAQDRAHRIGQTKEVRILRLITEESVEEAILSRALSKLEIDGKVIQAGKFDNKSTAEEQEAFLRSLIEAEEQRRGNTSTNEEEDVDEDELNEILARNDDEHKLFAQMDEERNRDSKYPKQDRLFGENELPDIYKQDISVHLETPADISARRERRRVIYDDGMTEEQWLQTMEEEEEGMRRGRKSKRLPNDANGSDTKKLKVDSMTPEVRSDFTVKADALYQSILDAVAPTDPPRHRAGVFLKLPPKKTYPDYYKIIADPISLAEIRWRIDSDVYTSAEELKADFDLMFNNARTYNEETSPICEDANSLQEIVDEAILEF